MSASRRMSDTAVGYIRVSKEQQGGTGVQQCQGPWFPQVLQPRNRSLHLLHRLG